MADYGSEPSKSDDPTDLPLLTVPAPFVEIPLSLPPYVVVLLRFLLLNRDSFHTARFVGSFLFALFLNLE